MILAFVAHDASNAENVAATFNLCFGNLPTFCSVLTGYELTTNDREQVGNSELVRSSQLVVDAE